MGSVGLYGGVLGVHGVVLGYMVESVGLYGGECQVTWWGSVRLHGGEYKGM